MKPQIILRLLIGSMFILPSSGGAAESPRMVSVSGSGEITAEPDRARVRMSVEARALALADARNEVNQVVGRFLSLADDLNISRKRVRTTAATVRPEYDWNKQTRERTLTGYYVSRGIEVDLHDLEKLGDLFERAASTGVNQMQPPELVSSRENDLRREALALAASDAQANAAILAKTLNAKLGAVRRIATEDVNLQPQPRPYAESRMAVSADSGGASSYEAGEIRFNARVIVEFDLVVAGGN